MSGRGSSARVPACGYTLDRQPCLEVGSHLCVPRYTRAVRFFETILVHTKGRFARKPFLLAPWQRDEIIVPVFGQVVWSDEFGCYRRKVTDARVEIARKNGKSELAAGAALLLLCADDEESAEVYGGACDRDQARKVYDVAERMVHLSPILSARLTVKSSVKRIIDERTASYYEVIAADAAGNLGHNPHGVILDEELTQPDGSLWGSLKTAEGARVQALFLRFTTATNDPASWSAKEHDEAERVAADPERAPHRHVVLYNIPKEADVFDERNWLLANPALGDFLSVEVLRRDALEAANDPAKENEFRQFRANQHVQQVTRWMPLHVWDGCTGPVGRWDASYVSIVRERLAGRRCFAGLDLASTTDLAAWALWFPPAGDGAPGTVLWRFWAPEAQVAHLDRRTGGRASTWVRQGWLTTTPGDWIDYETIHAAIEKDSNIFELVICGYDQKEATATAQWMMRELGEEKVSPVYQGFALSGSLKELMRLTKAGAYQHGGNPVARWNADSVEVKRDDQDRLKIVKPDRGASGKRIDGVASFANSLNVWLWHVEQKGSVYEERGMASL